MSAIIDYGDPRSIRARAVELVVENADGLFVSRPSAEQLVSAARKLADFIAGTNDAEVIGAVRELAKKVG